VRFRNFTQSASEIFGSNSDFPARLSTFVVVFLVRRFVDEGVEAFWRDEV
jgi:hypothetical protein